MTALLVLKPGLRDTQWRGAMRIGGTIAGSAAASGLALAFSSHPVLIAFTTGIASAGAFALPRANYAMFGFAVTLTAVLLIDLAQGDPLSNSKHRIVATIVGGLVALAIAWLGPRSPRAKPIDS